MKILVIGNSVRGIVCSARKSGHTIYALDNFCDVDMRNCAKKSGLLKDFSEKNICELANSFGETDAVILGPGFEKLKFGNILGNRTDIVQDVNDKLNLAKKLHRLGIPHPDTEPLARASGLRFPLMLKPRSGTGGMRNFVVRDEEELSAIASRNDAFEFIAQEFVRGIPCSASLIGTGDSARVIALNEQLIGTPALTGLPFAYCGNITPFNTVFRNGMIRYSEQIALEFGLMGSNGVDFIQTEKGVVVIEVNPRFQGSIDTIELSYGINIFEAHIRSFSGEMPLYIKPERFAAKNILYAGKKIVMNDIRSRALIKCMRMGKAADIPEKGRAIGKNEPLVTLLETGRTREKTLEKLEKNVNYVRQITEV